MSEDLVSELVEDLNQALGEWSPTITHRFGDVSLSIEKECLIEVMITLRDRSNMKFQSFIDICGVDWPERDKRFDVVYHLLSPVHNRRLRVKVAVGDGETIPSLVDVFSGALWFEREAYDMYGIVFSGHPDLRRLLTDYGFDGFPLRKTFPLSGYSEVRYDEDLKRVVKVPVQLVQEFRAFDFESPWQGGHELLPGDEKTSL